MKFDRTWNFKVCEFCLKNSHERVEMIKEKLVWDGVEEEVWVCPACGSVKKL